MCSGKVVVFGKVFVFEQMWCYSGKVVVFGQKWLYSENFVIIGQK